MDHFDRIEGYDEDNPSTGLYQRDTVTAHIIDETGKVTGETLQAYMYHRALNEIRTDCPIPSGDWMQRKRSHA